jgi:hypothetical protein
MFRCPQKGYVVQAPGCAELGERNSSQGFALYHQQSDATVAEKTHRELVELTVTCAQRSRITMARDVSEELWEMAKSYQRRAAALDEGKLPNIGDPPPNWTAHRD